MWRGAATWTLAPLTMFLTNIPTDLIYGIFLLFDSHRTLVAFITTHRLLYEIFKAYSKVILPQVVCNETGMDIQVLPYAWATIYSQYRLETKELTGRGIQPQTPLTTQRTPWTVWYLKPTHAIMQCLAKHYSIR